MSSQNPVKLKEANRHSMNQAQKSFVSNSTSLVNIGAEKNKTDMQIQEMRELYRVIMASEPNLIITNVGPYMWKYREQIKKRDEAFFIDNEFSNELNEYYSRESHTDQFDQNDINVLMNSIKKSWSTFTNPEKIVVWKHVNTMLMTYAQYLKCEREINNINSKIRGR